MYLIAILSKPRNSTKRDFTEGDFVFHFNVFFSNNCILRWKTP